MESDDYTGTAEDLEDIKEARKRLKGRIIHISPQGWGFISSADIKFTRIFFHWTALNGDTLKFTDLRKGMRVEFTPVEYQDKGWRAIKIEVMK